MTEPDPGGNPPAAAEFELLASLQVFGVRADASATFGSGLDTILAVRFDNLTLGEVLTYLVSKAEPGLNFKLTPPWDLLNDINLRNVEFEVDITNFRVGIRYDNLDVSFPLISLDRIEVWYRPPTQARSKSVDLSLFGTFLGADFTSGSGLTWDVLSQPAPSAPGQGSKYFDLEYLGVGQHVTLRDPAALATMAAVIQALEGSYQAVDPGKNPLATLTALKFDGSSGWLFGAKFSALETVTLSAVFNDPVLYGLRLALDGKRVGKLAGLEFEILYRKISDSLGVFHIELKLPDSLRKIQAGEADITLPIIDLDVYTNGDFLLDLGFPHNLDFSRSFQIDMIVWAGPVPIPVSAAAGLYFGVLDGQTASQVPQVTNGSFAPVIVAGFGVRVGLGKSVSIGPLDAGFFAGIIGILEGVLAWFQPDSDPTSRAVYYKVTGTVGIQIHIWGTVNFAVLQASLDIDAYATATVAIESYQPIEVGFEAGISISLTVTVLFFHVNLSFSATIRESFTIGQASPAPWVVASPSAAAPAALGARGIVRRTGGVVQASPVFAHVVRNGISWRGLPAPAGTAPAGLTLGVYLQPMLTAGTAGDRPGEILGSRPQPQLAAMLFVADRGQLEGALAAANADQPLTAGLALTTPDGTPLTRDGKAVFTQHGDTFRSLAGTIQDAPDVFSLGFLTRAVPGLLPSGTAVTLPDGTVTLDGGGHTVQDGETLSSIAAQLLSPFEQLTREALLWAAESAQLSVQRAQAALGEPASAPAAPSGPDAAVSASHLHALYVDLTTPGTPFSLSRVVDFLTSRAITFDLRPMPENPPQNPSFTVFPMPPFVQLTADGTTIDFGTGPYQATTAYQQYLASYFAELAAPAPPAGSAPARTAQPAAEGQPESVAAVLFADYFAFILRQLVQDALDLYQTYPYQAAPADTLPGIAARFGIIDPAQPDAAVAAIAEANKGSSSFFTTGARLTITPRSTQVAAAGETLRALATRLQLTPLLVALVIRRDTGVLAAGSTIQVAGGSYVTGEGDTLGSVAAGLAAPLEVVADAASAVPGLLKALTTLALPGGSYVVQPPDTLASIAAATGVTPAQVAAAAADVPDLLYAGVGFALPTLPWTVTATDSLDAIADRFGTTLAAVVAGANASTLLLQAGAPVTFGLTTQLRPGETLAQLAERFGIDAADVATALGDQAGLLAPGATLTISAQGSYVIKRGDTLASIAASFGTNAEAITTANPAVNCQPGQPCWSPVPGASLPRPGMGISMPVGLRINLPVPLSYQVGTQDTLAGIAARFGLGLAALVPAAAGATLVPRVTVVLPPVSYQVAANDTPLSIAARFGLTAGQLVLANTDVGFGTVVVPDAELLPLDTLVAELARGGSFDSPGSSLARFLLHGLRLPSPDELPPAGADPAGADPASQRLYPLYTLTGQQITPPDPLPGDYGLTLAANTASPRPAVTFAGGAGPLAVPLSARDKATLAGITGQLAQSPPIDAGVLAATRYPPYAAIPRQYALGKPVPWQAADQPPLSYDPAGTAAETAAAGQPTLLPFPDALRHQVAVSADADPLTGAGLRVGLASGSKTTTAGPTQTTAINGFGWATKADFGLRRVPDPNAPGQPLANVYEVFGVSQDATADLRQLLDYARGGGGGDLLRLALLYPLSATSAAGPGLQSDHVDPRSVLLVKANLSTRSNPPVTASAELRALAAAQDGAAVTAATMADARDFVTLLWEATVTSTGGYYLFYRVGPDGPGLPASIFTAGPTATVSLLVTAFPAAGGGSTISLRVFHNTALVTDNLPDPNAAVFAVPPQLPLPAGTATLAGLAGSLGTSVESLGAANATTANLLVPGQTITMPGGPTYQVQPGDDILSAAMALGTDAGVVAQAIKDGPQYLTPGALFEIYPEWLTVRGTVQPGAAGFRLIRADPDPAASDPEAPRPSSAPQDPETQLEVLFNLVGYQLLGTGGFRPSADGLPAGPARQTTGPLNHQLTAVGGFEPWIYAKQLRIDKFAASAPVAALDGQRDPYAGVGGRASFGWQPQDVFGNRLLAQQSIEVDIGYTDELVALSQWPSVVTGYQFTGQPGAAAVQVDIALDTSAYVPAPGEVFAPVTAPGAASLPTGIAAQASAHRDRYASIFWQLSHDLAAEVTTTVDEQAPHPLDVAGLAAFTSGAYGYLATVAGIVQLTTTVPAGGTLQSIADTYQVSPAELAQANRSAAQTFAAASLLAPDTQLTVENRCTVIENDTLAGIVQRSPAPAPADAPALAATNPALLVTPGAELAIPARGALPAATYQAKAGDTLASVAASFGLTPADIGAANAQLPGLLVAAQSVLLGSSTYTVKAQPKDTFASIAATTGATVASLATANATLGGLLVAGQTVAIPRHAVLPGTGTHQAGAGDTLGAIAQRGEVQVTALGSANSDVTGLLASGVQLGYTAGGRSYSTVTAANDTLSTVALRLQAMLAADVNTQQVTVALLAEANETVPCLAAGAALLVPPADVTSGVPVTASNPEAVFPLQTAVTLRRTGHVDPALAAAGAQDVGSVTTPLAPAVPEGTAGQTLALQQFAKAFEAAFAAPQLKLATTGSGSSGTRSQQLLAVQYGTATLNYEIGGGTPYFFAPRPLSTALWNSPGPIPIRGYTRGQPLGPAQQTSFTGADLDGWAQAFLTELDLVLSGNYAVAAYTLDPAGFTALVQAKNTIAAAIRDSVDTVTEPSDGPGPDLSGARDALYQRLLITLSTAYQVDTIVQFPVAVTAPADWGGDTAPRLRGQPFADTYTVQAGATLSSVASDHSFQAPVELLVSELADTGFLLTPGFEVPGQGTLPPYTVTGGDTLASVAAHFAMPVAQLGDALAGTPGLLLPGAAVNLVRRTYPLAADDTLFTVISYLALDVSAPTAQAAAVDNFAAMNATLPDLFAAGTILQVPLPVIVAPGDTITGLAAAHELTPFGLMTSIAARTDVLTPGASVTLAGQAVTIRPGDSLDSIAAEAGLSLDAVLSAVQDAAGLLAPGVIIALPGSQVSYTVRSGDTLAAIAAAVGQGATPSWIVTTQLDTAQALRAGTVVAYLSRVAGFTLSDANIRLAGSSPGSLTFLFRTASNTSFSNLALRLRYQVNQLEYGIEDVPWASGYQSSQWLTFLLPPPDAAIGTVDVPIPLRAHPVPPSVTSQRTIPFAGPLTLQELRRYDYDYSFSAQRAAQDAVSTSQLQNTVLAGGTTAASTSSAPLPGALAQYAAVRDGLEQDLALLTRVDPVVPATAGATGSTSAQPPPAQQALQVFTELAGQIAQAWAAWVAPPPASPPAPSLAVGAVPRHAPRYQVRRGTLATGEATVHLRPDGEAAAAHASDLVLGLRGHAAADASGDAAPGVRGYAGRRQVTFTRLALPADAPAPRSPVADEFDLLVPDRDVVTTQNIWGEVSVTRNASLLAGRPTNPAFIYAVPDVKAATPAVPLISWTGQFDLASVPFDPPSAPPGTGPLTGEGPVTGARPLADWLINFFDSLLNRYVVLGGDTLAKIAMRYDLTPAALAPTVADVPGLLTAGTELPLPAGGYHQVADGDTLASVAAASSIQLADLVQAAAGASGLLAPGVLIRPAAVSRTLRVAVDYGFPLATATVVRPGQESEIVSRLPVLLCPAFLFDSATDLQPGSGFCAALAQQLTGWASARGLPDGAGRWVLDVSLYTTLPAAPGAPAAQAPPLLELTNVRLDRRLVQHNPLAPGGVP